MEEGDGGKWHAVLDEVTKPTCYKEMKLEKILDQWSIGSIGFLVKKIPGREVALWERPRHVLDVKEAQNGAEWGREWGHEVRDRAGARFWGPCRPWEGVWMSFYVGVEATGRFWAGKKHDLVFSLWKNTLWLLNGGQSQEQGERFGYNSNKPHERQGWPGPVCHCRTQWKVFGIKMYFISGPHQWTWWKIGCGWLWGQTQKKESY